jgi:hypothetical protein
MRKNKILSIAITATLCLPIGIASAAVGSFNNVNQTTHGTINAAGNTAEKVLVSKVPTTTFDNISGGKALVDVPTAGIVYATELFSGDGPPALPNKTDGNLAAVLYTIDGDIDTEFDIQFTLRSATYDSNGGIVFGSEVGQFVEDPKLAISDSGGNYTNLSQLILTTGGRNDSVVGFRVTAQTYNLTTGDQLMLAYRIKGVNDVLGTAGNLVALTAKLTTRNDLPLNPERTVTIATSKTAVSAALTTEDTGEIKISVSDESKKFTGSGNAFVSTTTAQIGFLKITNTAGIKESDGETEFKVGEGTDGKLNDAVDTGGSKLIISNGQFAASKAAPGEVFINAAAKVSADEVVDDTATFKLDDTDFPNLSTGSDIPIRFTANGSTPINTLENAPSATLVLDFKNEYVKDLELEAVDLRQIEKNGTVCVVYVVPSASITREKINIRITNDTNENGTLLGTLYNEAGEKLGEGFLNAIGDELGAGKTVTYQATHLAEKITDWEGRAMLEITSTLPSLEVMALLRNQNDRSLLTNLSLGATGVSCNR